MFFHVIRKVYSVGGVVAAKARRKVTSWLQLTIDQARAGSVWVGEHEMSDASG